MKGKTKWKPVEFPFPYQNKIESYHMSMKTAKGSVSIKMLKYS